MPRLVARCAASFITSPLPDYGPALDGFEQEPSADGFLAAEMPIKGDKLSMVLFAPQSHDGLPGLEAKLTGDALAGWLGRLRARTVRLSMPKFKLETDYSLAKDLQTMGMKSAFDPNLVQQVKVDEEQIRLAVGRADDVVVPDLLRQSPWLGSGSHHLDILKFGR